MVEILNISTGIFPLNGSSQVGGPVTCVTFDGLGKLLWAGDDRVWNVDVYDVMSGHHLTFRFEHRATLSLFWWILQQDV